MSKQKDKKPKLYEITLQVFDTEEDLNIIEDSLEDGVISYGDLLNLDL